MVQKPVIFFDGVCGLCNRTVDFLIRHDTKRHFLFTPLQGKTASEKLPLSLTDEPDTIVYTDGKTLYYKSDAILRILMKIGGVWKVMALCFILPKFIRDFFYDLVANNRYKVFGKKESCRMPTAEEREVFLD